MYGSQFLPQVHGILDEIVMAGMVLETNLSEILKAVNGAAKHEKTTRISSLAARRTSLSRLGK